MRSRKKKEEKNVIKVIKISVKCMCVCLHVHAFRVGEILLKINSQAFMYCYNTDRKRFVFAFVL